MGTCLSSSRRSVLRNLLGIGCVALVAARCGDRAAEEHAAATTATGAIAATALAVETGLPEGDVPIRSTVTVVFDRPVARLGDRDPSLAEGRRWLEIDPEPPPGAYHWVGTRTLCYTAQDGLPPATAFRARVPAGVLALDGSRLPHDVVWEFATPRPALVASVPAAGAAQVRPGDPLVLLFNISVDPDAVARAAVLDGVERWEASRPDSALLRQLDPSFWSAPPDRRVALVPRPLLALDRDHELRIGLDFRPRTGTLGPAAEQRLPFRTYGPAGLVAVDADGASVLRFRFRTPVDADSLRAHLVLDPLGLIHGAWTSGTEVRLHGEFGFERTYTVTVRAGLHDFFGQRHDSTQVFTVTTGRRQPSLQVLPDGALMLPSAPRTAAVVFAGMGPVHVRARRITARDEARTRRHEARAADVWQLERTYEELDPGKLRHEMVGLRHLLPASGLGAVLVEATGRRRRSLEPEPWTTRTVLRWSALGVSLKSSAETGLAWATRLETGAPRAGVSLAILDTNGATLWRGTTDARGLASLPGTRVLGNEPWQLFLVAAAGADTTTLPFDPDWRLEPWSFGIPGAHGPDDVDQRAFLWTDRDLYRPGDTVRLAGLVRRTTSSGLAPAGVDSVELSMRDPMGRDVARERAFVDLHGGFAADFATRSQASVGHYWIEVSVPSAGAGRRQRAVIGSIGVELAAFRAAAFRASVVPRTTRLFPGDVLEARVGGAYWFGAPLAGASWSWTAVRETTPFRPHGFDEFSFSDPRSNRGGSRLVGSGTAVLGDSGTAALRVVLPPEMPAATQALDVEATIRDASGDAVSARAGVLYHPTTTYAGIAVERWFVDAGAEAVVKLVAVRADTALAAPGTPLEVELVRREFRSIRKLLVGGRVGYETTETDTLVEQRTVAAASEPVEVRFAPPLPGSYVVRAVARTSDDRTSPRAAASFWVAGARDGAWQPKDALRLEMTTDRALYRPGDVARVLVTTPVGAREALFTVEREGLLESHLVTFDGGAQVVEVPILAAYLPVVYVGLAVAERGLTAREAPSLPEGARLPRYAMGYVPLRIDVSSRRLSVDVRPAREEYAPGDTCVAEIMVRDASGEGTAARVGIAVVDEAVLALLDTPVPDPFAFFYAERPLRVHNADTRLRLVARTPEPAMPAPSKGEPGGDGAEKLAARSLFTTTAYWNPAVATDAAGRARVEFALPDNLTRFRIVAVAASGVDRFGSGSNGVRVAKPLTIEPALPRFAIEGDTLELAAVVTNRTGEPRRGTVRVTTEVELLGRPEVAADLPAGASRRVMFRGRAPRAAEAAVRFEARFGTAVDAVQTKLPVHEARIPRTAVAAGRVERPAVEVVAPPAAALQGTTRLDLALAASALAGARPAIDYVVEYPYWCVEQTASRLLVLVATRDLFAASKADSARFAAAIPATIAELEGLAQPWGGFSFWKGGPEAHPWLQAYAVWALARARRAGFAVATGILEQAPHAITRSWRGEERFESNLPAGTSGLWSRLPAGLGLLALSEFVRPEPGTALEPADVELLVDHLDELSEEERLWLALALDNWGGHASVVERVARAALAHVEVTAAGATLAPFATGACPAPLRGAARGTSLALWLASRTRPRDPLVPKLAAGLLAMRAEGHWRTTQEDALALLALASFRDEVERTAGPVEAVVQARGGAEPLLTLAAPAGSLLRNERSLAFPLAGADRAATTLEVVPRGPVHYTALLRWDEDARRQPAAEAGYTLVRRLERFEGSGPLRAGDLVVVTLEVVVPRESWYLALVDPLPGGLEIVQPHFAVESRRVADAVAAWDNALPAFPVTHVERLDRELRLFADEVPAGVYAHRYVARVRAAGGFAHLPARIEAMYAPELRAGTAAGRFHALAPEEEARR